MRQRHFIAMLGSAAAGWLAIVRAQQPQMKRIGALVIGNADVPSFSTELREGLGEFGHIERARQLSRLPGHGERRGRSTIASRRALAAKQATREIPIVILSGDPLGTGLVESLSRPGANITGLSQMGAETLGKCVELSRDLLPSARRVAVIANAADPVFAKSFLEQAHRAGSGTGGEISPVVMVHAADELEAAFATVTKEKADALVFVCRPSVWSTLPSRIACRPQRACRAFAEIGGLLSYGSDGPALFRRAAILVHKTLRGA